MQVWNIEMQVWKIEWLIPPSDRTLDIVAIYCVIIIVDYIDLYAIL